MVCRLVTSLSAFYGERLGENNSLPDRFLLGTQAWLLCGNICWAPLVAFAVMKTSWQKDLTKKKKNGISAHH